MARFVLQLVPTGFLEKTEKTLWEMSRDAQELAGGGELLSSSSSSPAVPASAEDAWAWNRDADISLLLLASLPSAKYAAKRMGRLDVVALW